jgi:hypothetical protein
MQRKIRLNKYLLHQLGLNISVAAEPPHQMCDSKLVPFEEGRAGVVIASKTFLTLVPITVIQTISARQGDRNI